MNPDFQRHYLKGSLTAALFTFLLFWSNSLTFYWLEPFIRSGFQLDRLVPIKAGVGAVIEDVVGGLLVHAAFAIFFAAFYFIPAILVSTLLEGFFGLMTLWRRPIPLTITIIVIVSIGFAWGFVDRVHAGNMPVSI